MIEAEAIRRRVADALPDAEVEVRDLTGTQDHYQLRVVSAEFEGLPPVQRHRRVYALFGDVLGGALHALSLDTKAPGERE
jgi:stress-induced morphogen